jgi:hypothetical protein
LQDMLYSSIRKPQIRRGRQAEEFKMVRDGVNLIEGEMKVKVESEKIIKAVNKLDGIEIVLENADDAKEAVNLILRKTELFKRDDYGKLREVKVTSLQEYETSAVNYRMMFLLEFLFEDDVPLDTKVAAIKEVQEFFGKI